MKRSAILILSALLVLSFAACKKKDKKEDKAKAKAKPTPTPMAAVMGPGAMLPAPAMRPAPIKRVAGMLPGMLPAGIAKPSAAGKPVLALLDKILIKQKALAAMLRKVANVKDLTATKAKMVAAQTEIMDMSIAALKKALTLTKTDVLAFAMRNKKLQAENMALAKEMKGFKNKFEAMKGGKELMAALEKEMKDVMTKKMGELIKLSMAIQRKIIPGGAAKLPGGAALKGMLPAPVKPAPAMAK